jgi:hypothetical protein
MDPAIKKAQEKIMYVAQDRDMLHAYRMREMAVYTTHGHNLCNKNMRQLAAIGCAELRVSRQFPVGE